MVELAFGIRPFEGGEMTCQRFADTISSIYEAAIDEDKWGTALDAVVEVMGARAAALMVVSMDSTPYGVNAVSGTYREFLGSPAGHDYLRRLRPLEVVEAQALHRTSIGELYSDDSLPTPAAVLDAREDYRVLREHCDVRRRIGMRLNENRLWSDAVTIGFSRAQERAPPASIDMLRLVTPHMAKAVEMGRMFRELRLRYQAALAAIDRVGVGLAIALPSGELIVSNAEAERIFSAGEGLARSRSSRLVTRVPELSHAIAGMIEEACRPSARTRAERFVTVPRPSGAMDYLVEITPLSDPDNEIEAGLEGALVKMIDPANPPDLDVRRFAGAYGLTPAEEAVARLVLSGHGPGAVAEIRNTSPNTARNQIAAIMRKAGTHTRSDLIRLMVRLLPPVR